MARLSSATSRCKRGDIISSCCLRVVDDEMTYLPDRHFKFDVTLRKSEHGVSKASVVTPWRILDEPLSRWGRLISMVAQVVRRRRRIRQGLRQGKGQQRKCALRRRLACLRGSRPVKTVYGSAFAEMLRGIRREVREPNFCSLYEPTIKVEERER